MNPTQAPSLNDEERAEAEATQRRASSKYEVITELGRGGMADVFLAMARGPAGFNKLIVVKQIREDIAKDARFLRMLLDEARLAAQLNHPNIVQTNEVGVDDAGRFFMTMEHLEGQSLANLLQRLHAQQRELPLRASLRIAAEALAGLHYAHELMDFTGKQLDVVHCDVSPHNLFVTYAGQVKLLDFGLARAKSSAAQAMSGEIRGKLYYMAPEQAAAQPVDRRSDIFAMGVVLWEMLTGHQLWGGQTDIAVACSLRFGEIPLLTTLAPNLPKPLLRACQKALAFRREERYATALDFQLALENIRNELPPEAGVEDLGTLVAGLFVEERVAIRKLVELHMGRVESQQAAATLSATSPGVRSSAPELGPGPDGKASGARPRSRRRAVVASALSLLAVAAVVLTMRAAPRPLPEASPARTPTEARETPVALTRVEIRVQPVAARIYWDEQPLAGNPFRGQFARDGRIHHVRAEAVGYEPQAAVVTLDRALTLDLTLEREIESVHTATSGEARPETEKPVRATPKVRSKPRVIEPAPAKPPAFEDPWGGK